MNKIQRVATATVKQVLTGASLTSVLQEVWQASPGLSSQQRGAVQDISYGVLRFYGQLDCLLATLLKKPLTDESLQYLLLVSLYQLLYSKAPTHAVVNHAVSIAGSSRGGKGAQGLVNAILRNFIRKQEFFLAQVAKNEVGRYSHPQWWINKLRVQYPKNYAEILVVDNQHPPMVLRVNKRRIDVNEYQQLLDEQGMQAELLWNEALKLAQPVVVDKLPGFADGLVTVQDAGAQLAASFLDVQDGMRVLDACAAPGGKSTHLLEQAKIDLTILDNDSRRLDRVVQNLDRLKFEGAHLVCGDAADLTKWWDGRLFDRILADVPCSASGVVRRHPDIKWLRRESDLGKFTISQEAIINALWQALNKGGKLLYVTCSLFIEENKLQIEKFLLQHSDAHQIPLEQAGMIEGQLLPDLQHDGFFYALLHKT